MKDRHGLPRAGVLVRIEGSNFFFGTTGAAGRLLLEGLPATHSTVILAADAMAGWSFER